ncbi:MAG: cupin domain-containing protein [Chloroflexota bacterium]
MPAWITRKLGDRFDNLSTDRSEIRKLAQLPTGSMVHCSLPAGTVSGAVRLTGIQELWYVVRGNGQVWRMLDNAEETVDVAPGTALTLPEGTTLQFRAADGEPLEFICVTMPPWPGPSAAVPASGPWDVP